jgi:hypothetical protein
MFMKEHPSVLEELTIPHLLRQISEIKKLEDEQGKSEDSVLNATLMGIKKELKRIRKEEIKPR